MKLLFSSLLLASSCALSSWIVSSGTSDVRQIPEVSVTEGEAVHITCCWTQEFERGSVHWMKNQTQIKTEKFNLQNKSQGSLQKETSACSNLTFTNISREDSGRYTCSVNVDIPILTTVNGTGTVITVMARDNTEDSTAGDPGHAGSSLPSNMIIPLAVVAVLLLITIVCFVTLRWRQAKATRVIYQVPHTDSVVAEMDKHSTGSSTGSSQWCQVPVYESFDYFERVQTKESG